jgi:pimeloyl-ACP methyl ester carboxylesterase
MTVRSVQQEPTDQRANDRGDDQDGEQGCARVTEDVPDPSVVAVVDRNRSNDDDQDSGHDDPCPVPVDLLLGWFHTRRLPALSPAANEMILYDDWRARCEVQAPHRYCRPMATTLLPCTRAGSGEPLLLLHGLGTTRADFAQILPLLSEHFDVLAVDLPGQGDAEPIDGRPTVTALADALEVDLDARGLAAVHILGNSLGARLALELARRGRARSVVAIAPSGLSIPPERVFQVTGMALSGAILRALRSFRRSASSHHLPRALLAGLRARPWNAGSEEADALAGGFGRAHFWRLLVWAIGADVATNLDAITCPVMLAQGSVDLIAAGQTIRFLPFISSAHFHVLPFAGHAAQGDVPALVADLVHDTAARAA